MSFILGMIVGGFVAMLVMCIVTTSKTNSDRE